MNGDTNRPRLIGDRSGDGLADPPGGVCAEFVAFGIIKLLHGLDQAEISFLNQVKEQHSPADISLGDADN